MDRATQERELRAMRAWLKIWRLTRMGDRDVKAGQPVSGRLGYLAWYQLGVREGTWPLLTDAPFWRLLGLRCTE